MKKTSSKSRRHRQGGRLQWRLSFALQWWFWVCWFLLTLVFLAWSWWGENGFKQVWELRRIRHAQEQKNRFIQSKNERLRRQIRLIQQDPGFVEWFARENLGMIGKNERLYIFDEE